jgi:3-phenylpropionate/cinnamic acid dioxygenase small subunit
MGDAGMERRASAPAALHRLVEDFYFSYASVLDERACADWPAVFTEDGMYTLTTHANAKGKGLYLAYEKGSAALTRRAAVASGYLKAQRNKTLHMISNVRVLSVQDAVISTTACFAMFRTARDRTSQLHACGTFRDILAESGEVLRFVEHNVIVDAETLPANMVDLF